MVYFNNNADLGKFSKCSDCATDWTIDKSYFDSRKGQDIFLSPNFHIGYWAYSVSCTEMYWRIISSKIKEQGHECGY
jgi:hypothetical protein